MHVLSSQNTYEVGKLHVTDLTSVQRYTFCNIIVLPKQNPSIVVDYQQYYKLFGKLLKIECLQFSDFDCNVDMCIVFNVPLKPYASTLLYLYVTVRL